MTARLNLDDVNGTAHAGMGGANHAGSWMCIVNGFAGMRATNGRLAFPRTCPEPGNAWRSTPSSRDAPSMLS